MMDADAVIRRITEIGIVPVVRLDEPDGDAMPLADALCAGGVPLAEVTFRAEGAERAIAAMKAAHPEMIVGAGTVLCEEHIDTALDAGADFIVTPGFDAALVRYAIERKVPHGAFGAQILSRRTFRRRGKDKGAFRAIPDVPRDAYGRYFAR